MSGTLEPILKFKQDYAIVRFDLRITVEKVVADADYADREVERLNTRNKDTRCYDFRGDD